MQQPPRSVLVLHEGLGPDARPDEADGLVQVAEVSEVLRGDGARVAALPVSLDLASMLAAIRELKPDCVFNLVESLGGDGRLIHLVPAILGTAGVSHTGSGSDAMYLSSQKLLAKEWMRLHGIVTPDGIAAGSPARGDGGTWIVKSLWEHASYGMDDASVVRGAQAARDRIRACSLHYGGEWFAERYIDGREFNVSVIEQGGEPRMLPIAEMEFIGYPPDKPRIVGYAAKWDERAPEYEATHRSFPTLTGRDGDRLRRTVLDCWSIFGLRGYARIDLRLDADGVPWVLEVNANPCLSRDAGLAAAALAGGMAYEELVRAVLEAAPPAADARAIRRASAAAARDPARSA